MQEGLSNDSVHPYVWASAAMQNQVFQGPSLWKCMHCSPSLFYFLLSQCCNKFIQLCPLPAHYVTLSHSWSQFTKLFLQTETQMCTVAAVSCSYHTSWYITVWYGTILLSWWDPLVCVYGCVKSLLDFSGLHCLPQCSLLSLPSTLSSRSTVGCWIWTAFSVNTNLAL